MNQLAQNVNSHLSLHFLLIRLLSFMLLLFLGGLVRTQALKDSNVRWFFCSFGVICDKNEENTRNENKRIRRKPFLLQVVTVLLIN
jgi:hypothetical protein